MFGILAILFLVVPIVEIYLIIQVGSALGVAETIGLLIVISVVGAWLVRHEGLGILARVQGALERGELPTNELIDGLLVLVAGVLMLTPGFFTDGVGLLLLLPPTRVVVRSVLKRRFRGMVQVGATFPGGRRIRYGTVWTDVRGADVTNTGPTTRGGDLTDIGPATDDDGPDATELGPPQN